MSLLPALGATCLKPCPHQAPRSQQWCWGEWQGRGTHLQPELGVKG